jgi:hypothetical protein
MFQFVLYTQKSTKSILNFLRREYAAEFSIILSNADWARVRRGEIKGKVSKGFYSFNKKKQTLSY